MKSTTPVMGFRRHAGFDKFREDLDGWLECIGCTCDLVTWHYFFGYIISEIGWTIKQPEL